MGVYASVHVCVDRAEPLSVETRIAVVELAMKHELITRECTVSVPRPMPIRSAIEAVKALFGVRATYEHEVGKGEPGAWLAERMRETAPPLTISSPSPMWKGERLTGPFRYTCYRRPKTIQVVNAYRDGEQRAPHEPPDGVIGSFFDVIEVDAKRDFDARSVASSRFVKELKELAGAKVVCRTSWV
jgi:hypothetical protein